MEKENTYIMNLEAVYIYKDILENKKTTFKNRDLIKLFSATSPYSLETIRIDKMFPDSFYCINNKQYTKKIINITFEKHYTMWDEENNKHKILANRNKIRKYLYINGFVMDDVKYIFYKRGSGKAKNGYALFIQEDMKKPLLNRSRLGLEFKENEKLDLTSLLAYESLVSSGIEFTIKLDPTTEILLIDDIYGKEFEVIASATKEINGEIHTNNELIKLRNCLTDGQGLLDESVFEKYYKSDKGFMLLRSDMFKCCAFNTKLGAWFEYNNITTLTDMFGNIYNASDIKLITTPNSLKFLKFADKFEGENKKIDCYNHWKNNIDDLFGVVKCDKEGNFGNYNRTTYQLLNSIPNLNYDELMELTKIEREYVSLLKNDNAVFKNYLGCDAKTILKFEKHLEEGDLNLYENTDLMNALLLVNPDIQYTTKFKKMKSDLIANYIGHLKRGKIRMKDTKYVTIISNPFEMLLASIGNYSGTSIMEGREIYCSYYQDGQDFCASRNPHINSGNVMFTTNKYHSEYKDWFNFSDNICIINFFDNDAPDRLQGCDTDSDAVLLLPDSMLCGKAKYCEDHFPTPINKVEGKSTPRLNNMKELQKLDVILSNNYIGKIVNLSQIINSYMNDAISKGLSKEIINELYQASSKLSSLSQIEIDKSKKIFDNVNMSKELKKIKSISSLRYIDGEDKYGNTVNKMVVPNFFFMISDFNEYRVFEKFNTPLDILQDVLVFEPSNYLKGKKNKEFIDLLVQSKELEGKSSNDSVNAIYKIIEECGKRINGLKIKTCKLNDKAKITVERKSKKEAINKLKKLKSNDSTILFVLNQCFGNKQNDAFGFKKYSMLTLNLLFISKKIQLLKCFINKESNEEVLIKINDKNGYNIFGNKYQKTVINAVK